VRLVEALRGQNPDPGYEFELWVVAQPTDTSALDQSALFTGLDPIHTAIASETLSRLEQPT
jgi:hypothetical protein